MPMIAEVGQRRMLVVWVAVLFGTLICGTTLVAGHFLSLGAAMILGIVVCGLAASILVLKRSDRPASLGDHLRLIWIYVGIGVLALVKAFLRGWTRDDTIGVVVLIGLLTLFVIAYRQRKTKNPD
jgi:hypothetical protein